MTAVAVWGHKPTPDELLARRVAIGYVPTCSLLKGGARILGHAAALTDPAVARG